MRRFDFHTEEIPLGDAGHVTMVHLEGFINASTFQEFQGLLDGLCSEPGRKVLLDFENVNYVNSTAIGALLQVHETLEQDRGRLALVRVSREVGNTMRILGITTVVPFFPEQQAAMDYLGGAPAAPETSPPLAAAPRKSLQFEIPSESIAPADASVLVVVPEESVFTDILRMRLGKTSRQFVLVSSCAAATAKLELQCPALAILEDSLDGAEAFLQAVKTDPRRPFVSVIKVYTKGRSIEKGVDGFKVWEDDYLVEPFEMMELFALSEAELARLPDRREKRLRQLHFTFRITDDNVQKALTFGKDVIQNSGLGEDQATGMHAAFSEAVDNARRHGNRHNRNRNIDVTLLVDHRRMVIAVEDEGDGFDYQKYVELARSQDAASRARAARSEGRIGGLGIKLMYECVDKLAYEGSGSRLRLEKNIPQQP